MAEIPQSHHMLLSLLQDAEKSGSFLTRYDILSATGWSAATFRAYTTKGQLSDFLHKQPDGTYTAGKSLRLTPVVFSQMLSQSKNRRGLGHLCKSPLSKSLLVKSKENMLLALELYNRPSLLNRLDGFVVLFCVGWELLLKAFLIERDGEPSIFKQQTNKHNVRETISLRESISRVFSEQTSKSRMNLERIVEYRDKAVHLLMPEIHSTLSRLFQSGVMNNSHFFMDFTKIPFIDAANLGMISLVGDFQQPSIATMKANYGALIGEEMHTLASSLADDMSSIDNIEFAIPINVELSFTSKGDKGEIVRLSSASDGIEGLKVAIINKPIDASKMYPYKESVVIQNINKILNERYDMEKLKQHLPCKCKKTGNPEINSHCFRAVIDKLKWKNGNNLYHRKDPIHGYHTYSDVAVEEFIKRIMANQEYLLHTKNSYSKNRKKATPMASTPRAIE